MSPRPKPFYLCAQQSLACGFHPTDQKNFPVPSMPQIQAERKEKCKGIEEDEALFCPFGKKKPNPRSPTLLHFLIKLTTFYLFELTHWLLLEAKEFENVDIYTKYAVAPKKKWNSLKGEGKDGYLWAIICVCHIFHLQLSRF